jgi:hypothetical protein
MERRPIAIPIVAAFLFVATAMAAVVGFALLFPGRLLGQLATLNPRGMAAFETLGRASGMLLLVLGAATAAAGVGLLRGKRWAWWLAVGLFAVNAGGDLVGALVTRDWLRAAAGAAVSSAFLYVLSRRRVRDSSTA